MPFQVPNAVNYPSPLNAVPSRWASDPVEGPKIVNCEVDWGTMGGAAKTLNFNLQNNATLNFSQIVALAIDNSGCGADLQFSFPDTETTISIPAYAPYTIVPVFSNQTMFYLSSPNAKAEDVTRFGILNSLPPPVAVPTSQEQNTSNNNAINGGANGTTNLITAGISGTVENVSIGWWSGSLASSTWMLKDGDGNILASGQGVGGNSDPTAGMGGSGFVNLLNFENVHLRFNNGLDFIVSGSSGGGVQQTYVANILYRTP